MRTTVQAWARTAGVLFILSFVAGGFGEGYVPSRLIVANDAVATTANIRTFGLLFRLGFAGYLVEAVCDIALTLIFYELLRPVRKDLSLLAAFFGLVATATYAGAESFFYASSVIVGGNAYLKAFSPDQINSLALLSLTLFGYISGLFLVFYGIGWVIRGYLMIRSGYFPKILGALMALGGLAFIARNFALLLAPAWPSGRLLLLMTPGALALGVWLIVKGVDVRQWEAKAAMSNAAT